MSDNLPHIPLPTNDWIDLYDLSGIKVGESITVENVGVSDIHLAIQATKPPNDHDAYNILLRSDDIRLSNNQGDPGAWAFCNTSDGLISVSVTQGFKPVLDITSKTGIGTGINLDAWGKQKVGNDFSLFKGVFTFDVPPSQWLVLEDDAEIQTALSTRTSSINGHLNVTSGATAGNSTILESRRHPGYQPNRGLLWSASIGFKDANKDGELRAGLFVRDENGAYFKTKGDGKLYACIRSLGVETHEEEITFGFPIDITLGNIYDIQLQWRGVGNIKFYAGNQATGVLQLVHEIKFLNTLDQNLSISNPAMSAGFLAENITEEVSIWCGCVDVTSEGGQLEREQYGSATTTIPAPTVSAGDPVLAIRSPHLINTKTNTRDASLARITVSADKKSSVVAYLTRDPTAVVGGAWVATNNGSIIEANKTIASVDVAKMQAFAGFQVAANDVDSKDNPSKESIDFYLIHGDILVLVCLDGAVVQINASIEWGEEV